MNTPNLRKILSDLQAECDVLERQQVSASGFYSGQLTLSVQGIQRTGDFCLRREDDTQSGTLAVLAEFTSVFNHKDSFEDGLLVVLKAVTRLTYVRRQPLYRHSITANYHRVVPGTVMDPDVIISLSDQPDPVLYADELGLVLIPFIEARRERLLDLCQQNEMLAVLKTLKDQLQEALDRQRTERLRLDFGKDENQKEPA